jgi:hypothetical protein
VPCVTDQPVYVRVGRRIESRGNDDLVQSRQGIALMQLQETPQQSATVQRRPWLIMLILRKLVKVVTLPKKKQPWHASDITHRGLDPARVSARSRSRLNGGRLRTSIALRFSIPKNQGAGCWDNDALTL